MNIEEIREYCISKIGTTEDFPFDETTLVFRIENKIYGLLSLNNIPSTINLKCDPENAIELREKHSSIIPGFHMNKKHWNTVYTDEIDSKLLIKLIDHSYDLIFKSLPKRLKEKYICE